MKNDSKQYNRSDPHDLQRFIAAQEGVYERALSELQRGSKESHWMWFIFPQHAGLGRSSTAQFYAIKGRDEAKAYLNHPILGQRLIECSEALLQIEGKSAAEIFDFPDDLKLRSCMTLFANISEPDSVFVRVLRKYFRGQPDGKSLELLNQE